MVFRGLPGAYAALRGWVVKEKAASRQRAQVAPVPPGVSPILSKNEEGDTVHPCTANSLSALLSQKVARAPPKRAS